MTVADLSPSQLYCIVLAAVMIGAHGPRLLMAVHAENDAKDRVWGSIMLLAAIGLAYVLPLFGLATVLPG